MTTASSRAVAARYARVASGYRDHWAPVLRNLAAPVVDELLATKPRTVVDLGCGTGAIASAFAAAGSHVFGADATFEMLAAAPSGEARGTFHRVAADAARTPLAPAVADAVVSTFMLQHVPRPGRVMAEAARVLRRGGVLGTVTWGADLDERTPPYRVLDEALDRAELVPPAPMKTWHALVDSPQKMTRYASRAGLTVWSAWSERREHRWTPQSFYEYSMASGAFARSIASLDAEPKRVLLGEVRHALNELPDAAFTWRPEIVYLIASRR